MAKIGFIGTGIMGKPMAQNLQKAGHSLFLSTHHDAAPADLLEAGAIALANPKEVAQEAEFIIVMVPDTPQVEDVLFRKDGIAEGVGPNKVVIDMSSISPTATKGFAEKIKATGAQYLDAPVSGGEVGAKAATLSIMVGGCPNSFERALPLFQAMGKNITRVGGNGDGQTAKVANQIIVALNIQAVAEALLFAARNGADPAKVREALMGGFASSRILEVHGERMVKGTFDPGFRISLHQKDLNLALAGARELNLNLPNTANAQQVFSTCAAIGGSNWDHSALIKGLEHMANFSIRDERSAVRAGRHPARSDEPLFEGLGERNGRRTPVFAAALFLPRPQGGVKEANARPGDSRPLRPGASLPFPSSRRRGCCGMEASTTLRPPVRPAARQQEIRSLS